MVSSAVLALLILNAKCDMACKYEGYDGGKVAERNKCACVSFILQEDLFTPKRIPIPKKDVYDY